MSRWNSSHTHEQEISYIYEICGEKELEKEEEEWEMKEEGVEEEEEIENGRDWDIPPSSLPAHVKDLLHRSCNVSREKNNTLQHSATQ